MPSSLAYKGFQLNQRLGCFQLFPCPISWNNSTKTWNWKYNGNRRKVNLSFLIAFSFKILIGVVVLGTFYLSRLFQRDLFKIEHSFACATVAQIVLSSLVADLTSCFYGDHIMSTANWLYKEELQWSLKSEQLYLVPVHLKLRKSRKGHRKLTSYCIFR